MAKYGLFSERGYNEEAGAYDTCGIAVFSRGKAVRLIHDVTVDRDKAEALVRLFNKERLEPSQVDEAIEGFLYDYEI